MSGPADPVSSFVYLTEHVPQWVEQLTAVTAHAATKNAEFVAEYARVVSRVRPKRIKSPSMQSIHSKKDRSIHLSQIDPQNEDTLPTPPAPIDIDPLEAGNKYLYAQAQKKRKPGSSIRSGASGPQKFRSKHQVIVYYDSQLQTDLDSMVKSIGVARNNLRKGRNALTASRGFQLPRLARRYDSTALSPSLENIRGQVGCGPNLSGKYSVHSPSQAPPKEDEACFTDTDQMLENVQTLYETAAHQFLRDGDCKSELETAKSHLDSILEKAELTIQRLRERAKKEEEEEAQAKAKEMESKEIDSDATLYSQPSLDSINVSSKFGQTRIAQTLEEMKNRRLFQPPSPATGGVTPPAENMAIEVDDDASDDGSLAELDISQFRMNNRLLRG